MCVNALWGTTQVYLKYLETKFSRRTKTKVESKDSKGLSILLMCGIHCLSHKIKKAFGLRFNI